VSVGGAPGGHQVTAAVAGLENHWLKIEPMVSAISGCALARISSMIRSTFLCCLPRQSRKPDGRRSTDSTAAAAARALGRVTIAGLRPPTRFNTASTVWMTVLLTVLRRTESEKPKVHAGCRPDFESDSRTKTSAHHVSPHCISHRQHA